MGKRKEEAINDIGFVAGLAYTFAAPGMLSIMSIANWRENKMGTTLLVVFGVSLVRLYAWAAEGLIVTNLFPENNIAADAVGVWGGLMVADAALSVILAGVDVFTDKGGTDDNGNL